MGVTTKDLARICGVSRTTITRALNGTGRISPETKDRILKTARELNYQPDLLARSLVKGSSMCIGVIVVDLKNQYFPKMINAMENRAKKYKYLLNITLHEEDKRTELELIHTLVGHRVDGLILSSVNRGTEFEEMLEALPIPVVTIGSHNSSRIPSVGIDEYQATREAVSYIMEKDYRRIVFVLPPVYKDRPQFGVGHEQRIQGFLDTMAQYPNILHEELCGPDYTRRAVELVKNTKEKTAFLCSGDIFAFYVMVELEKYGLFPPVDYGIMGFDCIEFFRYRHPCLASVDNNIDAIGEQAVELLIDMIETKATKQSIIIPHRIMQGETI